MYYSNNVWSSKCSKKRKLPVPAGDEEEEEGGPMIPFPLMFPKTNNTNIHTVHNRIYFNDDVSNESMTALNRELRMIDDKMSVVSITYRIEPLPIYLYITTNGGSIHAALSAIDCINSLRCPVYTVVDGFVASAGTLISLAGKKRYILPNAYMLIHELRSGVWGKMSEITEEFENLKKLMNHLYSFYKQKTPFKLKELQKLLKKDTIWNADECVKNGVADEIYNLV